MIFVDDSTIKIGGTVLPGLCKSLEIKTDAKVEEQEVEGSSAKPKQAVGYEDAKITIELILADGPVLTKEEKLQQIQNLFRRAGQDKPSVHQIVNIHTSKRGVSRVIFKGLSTKETNKKDEITASMEFWEYVPMTITASKKTSEKDTGNSSAAGGLTKTYTDYLQSRGTAPRMSGKTSASPAVDDE